MLVQLTKCPICQEISMMFGGCTKCWWVEPDVLRYQADSYESFKKFIIAEREGRIEIVEHKGFQLKKIVQRSNKEMEE